MDVAANWTLLKAPASAKAISPRWPTPAQSRAKSSPEAGHVLRYGLTRVLTTIKGTSGGPPNTLTILWNSSSDFAILSARKIAGRSSTRLQVSWGGFGLRSSKSEQRL